MRTWMVLPALMLVLVMACAAGAADATLQNTGEQQPEQFHSSIQEAEVTIYLGEDLTISQARKKAFDQAKRQVLESANTYMSTNTMVKNGELQVDLMNSAAEGAVQILEQKDFGVQDLKYRVWIKAEVRYVLKPAKVIEQEKANADAAEAAKKAEEKKAKAAKDVFQNPEAPLTVKIWTDKNHYTQGETVKIYLRGNRDFYARVVDVMSDGTVVQLLPNLHRQDAFFKAGEVYEIPGEGDEYTLGVVEPYGIENIIVYASEVPQGQVETRSIGKGLSIYKGSPEELGVQTRGLEVAPKGGTGFYEQRWRFSTGP